MKSQIEILKGLKELFRTQKLTALATQESGHPYLSLMAFAVTDDLKSLIIATKRETRKYSNMVKAPGVAFLIDNRSNEPSCPGGGGTPSNMKTDSLSSETYDHPERDHFQNTLAITGIGQALEVEEIEKETLTGLFLEKHPELETFVKSRECALVKIKIEKFIIISQFQEAEELDMR